MTDPGGAAKALVSHHAGAFSSNGGVGEATGISGVSALAAAASEDKKVSPVRRAWSCEEDAAIVKLVTRHGTKLWAIVDLPLGFNVISVFGYVLMFQLDFNFKWLYLYAFL